MAHILSYVELSKMPLPDLQREIRALESEVGKMRLGIKVKSEKNTAKYQRAKRELARMKTARTMQLKQLQSTAKTTKVPAPTAA